MRVFSTRALVSMVGFAMRGQVGVVVQIRELHSAPERITRRAGERTLIVFAVALVTESIARRTASEKPRREGPRWSSRIFYDIVTERPRGASHPWVSAQHHDRRGWRCTEAPPATSWLHVLQRQCACPARECSWESHCRRFVGYVPMTATRCRPSRWPQARYNVAPGSAGVTRTKNII